MMIKIRTKK